MNFAYAPNPGRVIFGTGTLSQLPAELALLKVSKPLLLSTSFQADQLEQIAQLLDGKVGERFTGAAMHTPVEVTQRALGLATSSGADSLVSVGGGSTTGLGKALAVRTGLPHISIPTTFAGSEMTPILGETVDGRKTTRSDRAILPQTVIYDVNLTMTLPVGMCSVSGVNAIAHAVEALYARNRNPIIDLQALEGVRALAQALPRIHADPSDASARELGLYGAFLCGNCLGHVGMSLEHKLCHTLSSFDLPHAETHTIVLPHALAYNAPALDADIVAKLSAALPGSDGNPVKGLNTLLETLQVKRALRDFGMKEESVDKAADMAMQTPYPNPRPLERGVIRELIRRAWAGEPARAL